MILIARNYASGFERHYVGYTGVASGDSPLKTVEGGVTVFTATPEVLNIQALTMMVNEPELFAWDDQGRTWRIDAATGLATAKTATVNLSLYGIPQHAIRDPEQRIVYLTCTKALLKYFPDADVLKLFKTFATGETGHMAGYGGTPKASIGGLILITNGAPAGKDGVWYAPPQGAWERRSTGLPPAEAWGHIATDPIDARRWLLLRTGFANQYQQSSGAIVVKNKTYSPLWLTHDAGLSWTEIPLPVPSGYSGTPILSQVEWGSVAGQWNLFDGWQTGLWTGNVGRVDAARLVAGYYPGTGASQSGDAWSHLATGQGGDVVIWAYHWGRQHTGFVPQSGATLLMPSGEHTGVSGFDPTSVEVIPGARTAVGVREKADGRVLLVADDYRTSDPTERGSIAYSRVTIAADGTVYLAGATNGGVGKLIDLTSPDVTMIAANGSTTSYVRSDRQTRTIVAAKEASPSSTCWVLHGNAWTAVPGPPGVEGGVFAECCEITAGEG